MSSIKRIDIGDTVKLRTGKIPMTVEDLCEFGIVCVFEKGRKIEREIIGDPRLLVLIEKCPDNEIEQGFGEAEE